MALTNFRQALPPLGWALRERPGTGHVLVADHDEIRPDLPLTILARVDLKAQCLYMWDKRMNREVKVSLTDLISLFPTKTGV